VCCGFYALKADGDGIVLEQEMEVTIPHGFVSGQKLTVQVPGFGKAILAVPPDSKPGEKVKFSVPNLPQELHKHQITALRRSKEVRKTEPLTYSITIPKNSGSEIIANVPGVGQVELSVPQSLAREGGPLYFKLPAQGSSQHPHQQLSDGAVAGGMPLDISKAISSAVSSAVKVRSLEARIYIEGGRILFCPQEFHD